MILKSTYHTYATYDSQAILLEATLTPTKPTLTSNDISINTLLTTYNMLHQQISKFWSICCTYISHLYLWLYEIYV